MIDDDQHGTFKIVSVPPQPQVDRLRRWRRDEYERLAEIGLLADEKVELLRGLIVRMSPQGPRHASAVDRLTEILVLALAGRARVRVQLPLAASEDSEPEPDLAVVPIGSYREGHPTTALLVIEVVDSSLTHDRRDKGALYAEGGVPEYWIVDTAGERIEVHSESTGAVYARVTPYRRGDTVSSVAVPGLSVGVDDVFA